MTDRRKKDRKHDLISFHPDINKLFNVSREADSCLCKLTDRQYRLQDENYHLKMRVDELEAQNELKWHAKIAGFILILGTVGGLAYIIHLAGAF